MLLVGCKQSLDERADSLPSSVRVGDLHVRYRPHDDEREYVGDRFVILADTIVDRSRSNELDRAIDDIIEALTAGLPMPSFPLGAHFLVVLDKRSGTIDLYRDPTGIKTGYYCMADGAVYVSTCVHDAAEAAGACEFDEEAVHQLLYLQYLLDGYTYYRSVREVEMGRHLRINSDLDVTVEDDIAVELADRDNPFSFEENRRFLREYIIAAHRKYLSGENVVLLSGGLDSAVMLGSLSEIASPEGLTAVSFKVAHTEEDETVYARTAAEHLKVPLCAVEVSPNKIGSLDQLVATVRKMNNPYYGVFLFGRLPEPSLSKTYFAGQDTRLHTPDINLIDKSVIKRFFARRRWWSAVALCALRLLLKISTAVGSSASRWRRQRMIQRLDDAGDMQEYILKYFFGCDRRFLDSMGVPMRLWDKVRGALRVDLDRIDNPRQLYNEIVRIKYREQYTDQIRYIQSLARVCGAYIALPFHDADLAEYCSSIPFDQATRFTIGHEGFSVRRAIITKLLLRRAFRDKLNDTVYYRKKAVSSSLHLLFNGMLGEHIRCVIDDDLGNDGSFLRKYRLEPLIRRFRNGRRWQKEDEKYLYRVYYMAMLCIYNRHILEPNRRDRRTGSRATVA